MTMKVLMAGRENPMKGRDYVKTCLWLVLNRGYSEHNADPQVSSMDSETQRSSLARAQPVLRRTLGWRPMFDFFSTSKPSDWHGGPLSGLDVKLIIQLHLL
jgi:hypothetical protein